MWENLTNKNCRSDPSVRQICTSRKGVGGLLFCWKFSNDCMQADATQFSRPGMPLWTRMIWTCPQHPLQSNQLLEWHVANFRQCSCAWTTPSTHKRTQLVPHVQSQDLSLVWLNLVTVLISWTVDCCGFTKRSPNVESRTMRMRMPCSYCKLFQVAEQTSWSALCDSAQRVVETWYCLANATTCVWGLWGLPWFLHALQTAACWLFTLGPGRQAMVKRVEGGHRIFFSCPEMCRKCWLSPKISTLVQLHMLRDQKHPQDSEIRSWFSEVVQWDNNWRNWVRI